MRLFKGRKTRQEILVDLGGLAREVVRLERELVFERSLSDSYREALRRSITPGAVQEAIEASVIQMPDGEYIASAAFDWDRLARDMQDGR